MPSFRRAQIQRPGSRCTLLPALLATLLALAGCQTRSAVAPAVAPVITPEPELEFVEPAPVVHEPVLPAVVDPADPAACCLRANLWDRIRAGFQFNLDEDNERIAAQRNWYIRNQQYLDRVIARGSRYMHHIVEEAEARDMPLELALLPVVESAFDPFAYSVADAAGPWQFIPSTGRIYGLKQDWWYDGRRDITLSTAAALDYLERLAGRFDGDYYKALASYNAGAGTISRAITRNLRAGARTDYWSLKVPQETAAYVPKLIALAQIVKDPGKYGVRLNPIADEPRFTAVDIGRQIDLARAAELAGIPLAELYLYNPAYSRWLTDPQGPFRLLVPREVAEDFRAALAAPATNLTASVTHEVIAGETLDTVAARYDLPAEAVRAMNPQTGDDVQPGTALVIPQPHLMLAAADMTYDVRILALNRPGRAQRAASRSVARAKTYKVRRGDTLSKVARAHRVEVRDLARWNRMKMSKPLRVGQVLTIQAGGDSSSRSVARSKGKSNSGSGDRRISHKVKRGETLSSLARKFKVSVHDIARWNDFSPKRQLRLGESVKLYID